MDITVPAAVATTTDAPSNMADRLLELMWRTYPIDKRRHPVREAFAPDKPPLAYMPREYAPCSDSVVTHRLALPVDYQMTLQQLADAPSNPAGAGCRPRQQLAPNWVMQKLQRDAAASCANRQKRAAAARRAVRPAQRAADGPESSAPAQQWPLDVGVTSNLYNANDENVAQLQRTYGYVLTAKIHAGADGHTECIENPAAARVPVTQEVQPLARRPRHADHLQRRGPVAVRPRGAA
ncbi:hypothetical protein U1Q18_052263 [Sarracenia purpurea var. burkii]